MSANKQFDTIQDLMKAVYDNGNLLQTDAPLITTTTGAYLATYGAQVWSQLNQNANTLGILPKYPWPRGGFRAVTARAAASGGGLAEAAAIPDTIKPTFAAVIVAPKQIVHTFETSLVQEGVAKTQDDALDFEILREQMAIHHAEMMNVMLLTDVGTLASTNLESIDRVICSAAEVTAESITSGDGTIYSLSRDSGASWTDAQVLHNSGTDRPITDVLLRTLKNNTRAAGANPAGQVFVTGFDTAIDIEGLYQTQVRYNPLGKAWIQPSVNGVKTQEGANFGVQVTSVYNIPLIEDKNTPKDTKSRVYLLDISDPMNTGRPRLGLAVVQPTVYFETKSPFEMGKTTREGMFITIGELVCTFFAAQGKIRDLL